MKKLFIFSIIILSIFKVDAQNISGQWQGYFVTATRISPARSYFFLDIKQEQKALWGVFNNYTGSPFNNVIGCLCSVTGIIPKGGSSTFDLYKDKIIDHNPKISDGQCDFVNKLSIHYVVIDNLEYLVGKWYTATNAFTLNDGSSGVFVLKHVSLQTTKNIDEYFPKLNKLLEKGKITDSLLLAKSPLLPDQYSSLKKEEIDLINTFRNKAEN